MMLAASPAKVTSSWLEKEVKLAEGKLKENEERLERVGKSAGARNEAEQSSDEKSTLTRLAELQEKIFMLDLSREVTEWQQQQPVEPIDRESVAHFLNEMSHCHALGRILMSHASESDYSSRRFLRKLWEEEYTPLRSYVRSHLLLRSRDLLRRVGYPSPKACSEISKECDELSLSLVLLSSGSHSSQGIAACMKALSDLQIQEENLFSMFDGQSSPTRLRRLDCVTEMCRPMVAKVHYHFLEQKEENLMSSRIDRLPEWVIGYITENVMEGVGPWSLISQHLSRVVRTSNEETADRIQFEFMQELCRLVICVLQQRNFFRDEKVAAVGNTAVATSSSHPIYLMAAIQQLLSFDHLVRLHVSPNQPPLLSTSQILIVNDKPLWDWWLEREREAALRTLLEPTTEDDDDSYRQSSRGFSPQSELFCALIHSVRSKASLLGDGERIFVGKVGVPLCQIYLDASHETASDLKQLLSQRPLISEIDLQRNMTTWIELVNGTNMAVSILSEGGGREPFSGGCVDQDLVRVGRSVASLRDAFIDECASTIVEVVLMERAKLASYLMRQSHSLASDDEPAEHLEVSADLHDVVSVFTRVVGVCDSKWGERNRSDLRDIVMFGPNALRTSIINLLAEKFLEVVMDAHGLTPELSTKGCQAFARDVASVIGVIPSLPPFAIRLMDAIQLMRDTELATELKGVLSDLASASGSRFLSFASFAQDSTLMEEAMSMIRAKGFAWIHLEDVVSILNRRTTD